MTQPEISVSRSRWTPRDVAPFVSLMILLIFFTVATGGDFFKVATFVQVLRQGAILGIVAVGLTFVLLCGEIDLSVGMVALWCASFSGWLYHAIVLDGWTRGETVLFEPLGVEHAGGGWILLIIALPLLSCLLLGLISGWLTVWAALPSFIITLAMMNIADGLSAQVTQSAALNVPEVLKTIGNRGIPITEVRELPYSALVAVAVFVLGHIVLEHTRFGRYVFMTGGNREAARLAGVRTDAIIVACLAVSAFTAGLGGLIVAGKLANVSQDQNASLLLEAVACVVLGGTSLFGGEGSMTKTAIGVLTFSVLAVGLNQISWVPDLLRPFVMGVVLMVALVVNGVLAKRG